MTRLFIDVPDDYQYDWSLSSNCSEALRIEHDLKSVQFIYNSFAQQSKGDLYSVELFDFDTDVSFRLRTGLQVCIPPFIIGSV